MTRALRILQSTENVTAIVVAAPPPEAVALESDFVVILAALLCALICVVGLVAVARCAWLRRDSGAGNSPQQALANKGLKKKVLQSLPKFAYVDSTPGKWLATSECAICLSEFTAGDEIRVLPQCGHGFHVACIDTWLGSHSSCPSCRQILAVTRCQKCGRFPATGAEAAGVAVSEPDLKSREDDNVGANSNEGGVSSSNSNNSVDHIHISVNSGFLP
ncbi:RING-H2 finger protein ATL8 [Cicer arietinum]|uniref:RING-type E3 ubiquitin transferase n=1 Tax=Cicer arietinum TaxID=3827 RepID=A0A1S2YZA2_CICAR|nr:RING-H2 finger protein ATL8 [Cicer arietinum]